jgi:DNA repair exonuclease SbcCD ATPase subunit
MNDNTAPSDSGERAPLGNLGNLRRSRGLSTAQWVLLILFIGSTGVFLSIWLGWGRTMIAPGIETPLELPPGGAMGLFWLILTGVTSLASLTGLISATILGWRKEQREARAEALARRRQELEIEKLELELARAKAQTEGASQQDQVDVTDLPSPDAGERRRLQDRWEELDRQYQAVTRHVASLDRELSQTLDAERRLVLHERRDELAAQRDAIAAGMASIERRVTELNGST